MENKKVKTNEAKNFSFVNFVGAMGGLVSGFVLILSGFILSAVSLFTRTNFNGWEVILIVTGFIFLAMGAHFLDLIDRKNKVKRKQKLNL
jgi:cytochrome c biogenesis protein CcdA